MLSTADHAPSFVAYTKQQSNHLNGGTLDRHQA
jgi:hypothetical protein